jgi:hypothetical protein
MAVRVSLLLWLSYVVVSLLWSGVVFTILSLIGLHVVLLRAVPYFVFDLIPYDVQSHATREAVITVLDNRRNFFHMLHMEKGFNEAKYRAWLREKFENCTFLNREIKCYGPDTLFLYYLRKRPFSMNDHVLVEAVSSEKELNTFYSKIIDETMSNQDDPLFRTWFLPNAPGGPLIVTAMNHDIMDGESFCSLIR